MVTKIGKYILKRNSKTMDILNYEMIQIAKRLKSFESPLTYLNEYEYNEIVKAAASNRENHRLLQSEINKIIEIESWLSMEDKK